MPKERYYMRKIFGVLLSVLCICCAAIGLTGCKNDKHIHTFDKQVITDEYKATDATCTEAATYYYSCECGEKGTETFTSGNALGHSFTNYVSDNNATCTEDGTMTAKCDRCDKKNTVKDIDSKLHHSYTEQIVSDEYLAAPATCTKKAKYYYSCKCGATGIETFAYGDPLGHSFTNYVSDHNATCTEDGTKTAKCDRCDKKNTVKDIDSKLHHSYTEQIVSDEYLAAPATCTKKATYYYSCVCGEKGTETFEYGDPLGHSFTNYLSDNNATCTEDGTKTAKCDRCNETDTIIEAGSAKGHTEVIDKAKAATCTETGLTEGKHCSVCNKILIKQDIIPAKGHTEVIDSAKAATCTESGLTEGKHCSVCNTVLVKQNVVPAKGHTYSEEWTTNETEHWHSATCGHNVEKDRATHTFDENKKCTVCDYITVKPLGLELHSSVFNIEKSNKTGYLKVANTVTDYDFSDKFTVADGARFDVCTDKQCNNKIASKKTDIVVGDNIFYILVTNGNDVTSYTVTLRRRPIYTVFFNTTGGNMVESQQVEEENFATEPITQRKGYNFITWDYDFSSPVLKNETITASWNIITYNIIYVLNGGKNATNNPISYTIEDEIPLSLPTKTGYTGSWDIGRKITKGNTGDKTITAIYTINQYNVSVVPSISDVCAFTDRSGIYDYNTSITLEISNICLGYDFNGWYNGETLLTVNSVYTFKVPANDYSICAKISVKQEMQNYEFTSTPYSCEITGVKDKTITSAIIPEYVSSIDSSTFADCPIKNITLPTTAISLIPKSKLEKVVITSGKKIDDSAFYDCVNLTSVTIPDSVNHIGSSAFSGCYGLTSVTIPDSVNHIGSSAFSNCHGLKSVTISNKVTCIDGYTFFNCSGLTSVIIPNKVTTIEYKAFNGCKGLTNLTIPCSITSIGHYAFEGCISLENIYITDITAWCNISMLDQLMRYGSNNKKLYLNNQLIEDLVIPNKIISINFYTFYNCIGLTSVTIHNDVIKIDSYAFSGCSGLTSVTIPDSVTEIGPSAFRGCTKLTSIEYNGTINQWKEIIKYNSWDENVPRSCVIHCTDGDIKISD